jgi:isopropylmalate/homocitrate/citramalate synthase
LPTKNPNWVSSPHNFRPEVLRRIKFPSKLQLYDVTCRDGEQRPGVVFRKDDKVRIAQKLDEVGIQRIEAGMPAVSDEDFNAVKEIAHLGLSATVVAFSRARRDDVDLALKAGVSNILIEAPSSDSLIETGFGWKKDRVLELALDATQYAKAHGLKTTFFAVDSARADPKFLKKLYTSVLNHSHVDSIVVVDTFGVTSPEGFAQLVRTVKKYVKVPIEVHCHNDFGLGTANALAGMAAGASIAHTNVNGIGERAGGASTEEVAVALRILYGKDLGFNYGKLYDLSQFVQKVSGVPVSPQKPVVGETAFGYEAGIAVMFSYRFAHANAMRYALPYLPEFVGNKFSVTLGKKSGTMSIRWRLEDLNYEATDEQVDRILARVKETGVRLGRGLRDDEFLAIVKEVLPPETAASTSQPR